jgi:2-polyprenyl-3-methyl-5-hydroxy-6-metoxy-1,4-benzoquinol methylase
LNSEQGPIMDKSSRLDIPIEEQRQAWNRWNESTREVKLGRVSELQSAAILRWMTALARADLRIIDVGCGTGWMSERLAPFGHVTATDLADEVLQRARVRAPHVEFISGDFMQLPFERDSFDVAVSLEVLSHVADQPAFIRRIADLLKPGGHLMLATQNRYVLERWSEIPPSTPGYIRHWVSARTLRRLLRPHFEIVELTSVMPVGDQGPLRLVNSVKLNSIAALMASREKLDHLKEKLLLGHTLLALARKRANALH